MGLGLDPIGPIKVIIKNKKYEIEQNNGILYRKAKSWIK